MLHQERKALVSAIGGTLAVLLALLLALTYWSSAQAQTAPAQTAQHGSGAITGAITVVGEGTITLEPDIARANIGVEAVDESVQVASQEAESVMADLLEALAAAEIAERDIQTASFSIYSERGTMNDPEAMRYRVNNQVQVTIRDLDRVGEILDLAMDAGANQIYGVQFTLEDPAAHEGEARQAAVAQARAKAEELAALSNQTLGPVLHISEIIGDGNIPMLGVEMSMADDGRGGGGTSILPGEYEVTVHIQVAYALADSVSVAPAPAEATEELTEEATEETADAAATAPVAPLAAPAQATLSAARLPIGDMHQVIVEGGDEAALRRYLETSLQPIYPGMGRSVITVTIGALPADLPAGLQTLELPPELEVVGATVRTGEYGLTDIMLAGPAPAATWVDDLRGQLLDQGYSVPDSMTGGMGSRVFQGEQPMMESMLCSDDQDMMINLMGGELEDEAIIRMILNPQVAGGSICTPHLHHDSGSSTPWLPEGVLPTLQAPAGVIMRGTGSSSSDRMLEVTSELVASEISAPELYAHWVSMLQEQGWTRVEEDEGRAMVWSHWTREVEGTPWTIIFYILRQSAEADQYTASLRIERAD
ncbi:MAG: SIMPL domain-containing protein [Litorilinea sp.]